MDLYKKFKKANGTELTQPVNKFFDDYITRPDFINYVEPMNEHEFDHVDHLFKYTAVKCKIVNVLKPKMDPKTQEFIIWVHIELPKGKIKLPIPHHEGMLKYLEDYQQTNLWFEADFESLLSEAGMNFTQA